MCGKADAAKKKDDVKSCSPATWQLIKFKQYLHFLLALDEIGFSFPNTPSFSTATALWPRTSACKLFKKVVWGKSVSLWVQQKVGIKKTIQYYVKWMNLVVCWNDWEIEKGPYRCPLQLMHAIPMKCCDYLHIIPLSMFFAHI